MNGLRKKTLIAAHQAAVVGMTKKEMIDYVLSQDLTKAERVMIKGHWTTYQQIKAKAERKWEEHGT